MAAWFALQVHQDPFLLMLGDELQDAIEMLVELVHLAQRLEDPMVPTHMSSETYVLIRIVNVS